MTETDLRSLLVDTAVELGHRDRWLLADRMHTVIDDTPVSLQHNPLQDPRRLVLRFEVCELPPDEPRLALVSLATLMQLNLLSGSKTTGVFALDAATSRLQYVVHLFDPHRASRKAFAQTLRDHAQKAKAALAWIQNALDDEGEATAPPGNVLKA